MGIRETLAMFKTVARGAKARAIFGKPTAFDLRNACKLLKRMCAALRREPHLENDPPSTRE
eukprot:6639206-Pyramimonas_sp.AAC.1